MLFFKNTNFRPLGLLLCLTALLAASGCAPKGIDVTRFGLDDAVIAKDLALLPQDLNEYAKRAGEHKELLPTDEQARQDAVFNKRFFAAWDANLPRPAKDTVFEGLANMGPGRGFAENLRPYPQERWGDIQANCDAERYGETPVRPAITVTVAHLRRLPTDAPYFSSPDKAGEGYPFDYLQSSVLWVGTPVAVVHVSRDGQWVYVTSHLVSGWTKTVNVAAADKKFMAAWRARQLSAVLMDDVDLPLADAKRDAVSNGPASVRAHIGAVLPLAEPSRKIPQPTTPHTLVHVPLRNAEGMAVIGTALAPMYAVKPKPLPLTPGNVAMVGQGMMGQPYGWGGLFGQRDCSAAMRDIFAPFGIWLPRNSRPQGQTGTRVDLANLKPEEKEERIMRDGVPFFSLVSMPGHVGLYLGVYPVNESVNRKSVREREVPVMFHNIWGLRTVSGTGENAREGRAVIGKAVVTTLRPGAEHPIISSPASLLDRIAGLAVLPEKIAE